MTMEAEIWVSPDGIPCELTPVDLPVDDEEPWFPESPGQRPPRAYELRAVGDASNVVEHFTVFPVEPWSPYDAVSDRLRAYGWEPPEPEPYVECEHGLNFDLCAGPMHYPQEDRW